MDFSQYFHNISQYCIEIQNKINHIKMAIDFLIHSVQDKKIYLQKILINIIKLILFSLFFHNYKKS